MFAFNYQYLLLIVLMGVAATVILDLWAVSLNRIIGWPPTNWALVGRWFSYLPRGRFLHSPISATTPVPFEKITGWTGHYFVGIAYAMMYMAALSGLALAPSLGSAIVFGVGTILAPWMILQPGMGAGFFASATPNPPRTRAMNIVAHAIFGLGLYGGWWLLASII
jgi:hypothetical protein